MNVLNFGQTGRSGSWAIVLLLTAGLSGIFFSAQGRAEVSLETIPLASPYVTDRFGTIVFFPAEGRDGAKVITPGKKHLEIDKSAQRLQAFDERGRRVFEAPVSTGKPGIDEKGRESAETLSGIHRIIEVKSSKRWSKDPRVKMLNWIGLTPGIEKGMHSLNPIGEFAGYEKRLGQKASHGCIRLSRESSRRLVKWIGEEWRTDSLIVYIYDPPLRIEAPSEESHYMLFLVLQEGIYSYDLLSDEAIPIVRQDGAAVGHLMKRGSFLLYKREVEAWHLIQPPLPR